MLKKLLAALFVAVFVGTSTYFIAVNIFYGLKIKGYDYLFRETEPYDLVIKHARILDGTSDNDAFRGDIAIRDGRVVGVGYVVPKETPVFDAGGLTFMPWPLQITKGGPVVEHLLRTSYPRYEANEIFLTEAPYEGLSLAEAASSEGIEAVEMFERLKNNASHETKVLLVPMAVKNDYTVREMLARLTAYRAALMGLADRGAIKDGYWADFYVFKTSDYPEEELLSLLSRGSIPEPVYRIREGQFLNL